MTSTNKTLPALYVPSREHGAHQLADSFCVATHVLFVDGGPALSSRSRLTVVMDPSSRLVLSCALRA